MLSSQSNCRLMLQRPGGRLRGTGRNSQKKEDEHTLFICVTRAKNPILEEPSNVRTNKRENCRRKIDSVHRVLQKYKVSACIHRNTAATMYGSVGIVVVLPITCVMVQCISVNRVIIATVCECDNNEAQQLVLLLWMPSHVLAVTDAAIQSH
mmetsp:Transcript_6663/g.10999  ORF Transcript_6663/g.10999 Transcript_6663/m.10999 type:complete len:152 (+) Transcript_6663:329-784(+)